LLWWWSTYMTFVEHVWFTWLLEHVNRKTALLECHVHLNPTNYFWNDGIFFPFSLIKIEVLQSTRNDYNLQKPTFPPSSYSSF
jgi:hypothetical protein